MQFAFITIKNTELGYDKLELQVEVEEDGSYSVLSAFHVEGEETYHVIPDVVLTEEDHESIIEQLEDVMED